MTSFDGFSEEDIEKLKKSSSTDTVSQPMKVKNDIKNANIGSKPRRPPQTKFTSIPTGQTEIESSLEKCKLSIETPTNERDELKQVSIIDKTMEHNENKITIDTNKTKDSQVNETNDNTSNETNESGMQHEKVDGGNDNGELDEKMHSAKIEELRLKQKLMEEQNRKRKDMLAKALADRAKQTEEEVLKLEKIKRELSVLDGQFSQEVGVLRKKIDQASLTYAEAEKQYLRVEKEFLQAKLNLQKEKEKKELLSEHLCQLIMHKETRKAQKLVTLMEQLAHFGENSSTDVCDNPSSENDGTSDNIADDKSKTKDDKAKAKDDKTKLKDDKNKSKNDKSKVKRFGKSDKNGNSLDDSVEPIVVDGVDERTGKMVEVEF